MLLLLLLLEHVEPLLLLKLLILENSSGDGSVRVVVVEGVLVTSDRCQRRSCIVGVVEEASTVVQGDLGFCLADLRSGAELLVVALGDRQLELFLVRFLKMGRFKIQSLQEGHFR